MNLAKRYEKERGDLIDFLMDNFDVIKNTEADTYDLTQKYWAEGNSLFSSFYDGDHQWTYNRLHTGPWDNCDLSRFFDQVMKMKKLMSVA